MKLKRNFLLWRAPLRGARSSKKLRFRGGRASKKHRSRGLPRVGRRSSELERLGILGTPFVRSVPLAHPHSHVLQRLLPEAAPVYADRMHDHLGGGHSLRVRAVDGDFPFRGGAVWAVYASVDKAQGDTAC